ncbi:arylamine N-acetyltransferase family protein [Metabacillus litoralis]|uniref:arylamine N-acetyltransferase family protein n=1 Tax=Metabacillus litoralis TaxID=152268 RepID=UPI00203ECD26|nr:arylamine N-acetyltransferase [Metabacillus litoralis]MCM3654857.1 arylamine N-acetyltransferase [Metabacillus litoralis]
MKNDLLAINELFRKRVGISENEMITFETLDYVLEKAAKSIPFENLCIIANNTYELTKENLLTKIVLRNEGGLCYELNTILNFFLIENGFKADLIRGITFNHQNQCWNRIGRTHVANLVMHNGELYIIDIGFGGNLPLKPVPLNGESVTSENGEFRVKKEESKHGDYIFEMKLKHKDKDWKAGYAFDSKKVVEDMGELNEIQKVILEHEESSFNKKPLINRITDNGNITLTNSSFTEWTDGIVKKEEIDENKFKELSKEHFGLSI